MARLAGRWRGALLALLIAPFWISYMMRMLAWVNLLPNDGLVNRMITLNGTLPGEVDWLSGRSTVVVLGLVYGYVPYMIIPLYAGLDRLPQSMRGGGPRPRRQPDLGVLPGDAADVPPDRGRQRAADLPADAR